MFGISQKMQFLIFAKSMGIGFWCGGIYVLLKLIPVRNPALKFVSDVIFFVISAVISFLFCYESTLGVGRAYVFAGEAAGFALCRLFFGFLTQKK